MPATRDDKDDKSIFAIVHVRADNDRCTAERLYLCISGPLIFHSCRITPRNLKFYTKAKVKEGKITLSKASIFALAQDRVIYIEKTPSGKRIDWRISRRTSVRFGARVYILSLGCIRWRINISLPAKEWLGNVQARWNSPRIALRGSSLFESWMKISHFLQNILKNAGWKMTRDLRVGIDNPDWIEWKTDLKWIRDDMFKDTARFIS